MKSSFRSALTSGVAFAAVLAASSALAGGFALREQSALGMGDAFAGAAAGGAGLGSMFWNPATITNYQGKNSSWNVSGILPYANTQAGAGTAGPLLALPNNSGNIGQAAVLPASYSSMQISERWWFGVASNTPFGLTTKNPRPWAGQNYGLTSKVATYEISPTIGYKVNDFLSLGLAYRLIYSDIRLTQANALGGVVRLLGNGLASGFSLGATLKPGPNTEVGIGYRSRVEPRLEGRIENPLLPGPNLIKAGLTLPDQVTVGVRHRLTQDLTVLAGFEWTHWKLFNRFPVYSEGPYLPVGSSPTTLAFGWRNGWYASVGAEYRFNPALTLRAGLGYESSPITNQTRAVRLPDTNRVWTTAGLSYQFNQKISIDASYAHIFGRDGQINLVAGNPSYAGVPFVGRVRAHVDIISVGVNYRWDDPAPAVVAKY